MNLNWFQIGPIPANAITGHYNLWLVTLSYVIAVLASYVALDFVGRLRSEQNNAAKLSWLAGGAFTMGCGIWSMHFIGMLAFVMPMSMSYEFTWTAASLFIAMLASALALFILRKKEYSSRQLALGGILIGFGIAAMHYMGMKGMEPDVSIRYLPSIFILSIAIAIFAAEAALWLALQSNQGSAKRQLNLKIVSALVMGVAICGMHYTGMSAAVFIPNMSNSMSAMHPKMQPEYLAFFVAGIAALIISLALAVSTYYKMMINAVQNEKEFLNAMLNNLVDGIIACDEQGKITVLNNSIQKNIRPPQAIKTIYDLTNYFTLYTSDNKPISPENMPLNRLLEGKQIDDLSLMMRFNDNTIKDVVIDGQLIIDTEGTKLGAVTVIHDVTALKNTERLKNEFVSIVSHELRTPLTSIRGSIGLLKSGVMDSSPDKLKTLIDIADSNCDRLLLLINDILDIEKIEAGKMNFQLQTVDLKKIVGDAIQANKLYADKYDVTIELIADPSYIPVLVDPDRLNQVLANLISNACKFSPKGDRITVVVERDGNLARVSITDRGAGIPEEFQSRIFQKFSQADSSSTRGKGGTGLGLNISKTIIERMAGKLGFNSKINQGTTFYFDLPIQTQKSKLDEGTLENHANGKRLLICEDDESQAFYLAKLLESAGYITDQAYRVAEAKSLLASHDYHAILLDLILPDQDGISFIRELRSAEKTKDLPIIVLSVIAETGKSLLKGEAIALIDWLEKPVDMKQLITSINRTAFQKSETLPRILHIEDDPDTQQVIKMLLTDHANVTSVSTLQQSNDILAKENFDLIILDLLLPDGNGVEILPLLAKYHFPIIVFSASQLDHEYAKYVSRALIKAKSSNENLLETIKRTLNL